MGSILQSPSQNQYSGRVDIFSPVEGGKVSSVMSPTLRREWFRLYHLHTGSMETPSWVVILVGNLSRYRLYESASQLVALAVTQMIVEDSGVIAPFVQQLEINRQWPRASARSPLLRLGLPSSGLQRHAHYVYPFLLLLGRAVEGCQHARSLILICGSGEPDPVSDHLSLQVS